MITIEGTRYISAKTLSKLKGIALSTISINKHDYPVHHFDEINMDLYDFDLLELADEVRQKAEVEFATRENLSTYSAAQLGNYFTALITRLTDQAAKASLLRSEAEVLYSSGQTELMSTQQREQELQQQVVVLQQQLTQAQDQLTQYQSEFTAKLEIAASDILSLRNETTTLKSEKNGLEVALQTLETIIARVSQKGEAGSSDNNKMPGKRATKASTKN